MSPLHWECGVLATGPPGKSLFSFLKQFTSAWLTSFAFYLYAYLLLAVLGPHCSGLSLQNTSSVAHGFISYGSGAQA